MSRLGPLALPLLLAALIFPAVLVLPAAPAAAGAEPAKGNEPAAVREPAPHIVVILADDLGWADLGCYGNTFHQTPHLDALASQGMRFTQAYAAAGICSPTRAAVMTGRHPAAVGITDFIPGHRRPFAKLQSAPIEQQLPLEEITLAEVLRGRGYATGFFGKWHLGNENYFPQHQGFEVALVSSGGHFGSRIRGTRSLELPRETWLGDWLTEQALAFLRERREEPALVFLSHFAVHTPIQPKPATAAKYAARAKQVAGKSDPNYGALVEDLDSAVGRLLAGMEELGLAESAWVIFTSDNGGLSRPAKAPQGRPITVNDPLRGQKGTLYEGGIRVPLLIRRPGKVRAGSECAVPVTSQDLLPTLARLAGGEVPRGVTGLDLAPLLTETGGLEREALHWHFPHYHNSAPVGGIRRGDWKLLEYFEDGRLELFHLGDDLGESRNLVEEEAARARELREELAAWRKKSGARMPLANPKYDPARAGQFAGR